MTASTVIELSRISPITAECVCFNLRKASRAVTQFFDEGFKSTGLGANQLSILFSVAAFPEGVPVVQLADVLVMDRSTLTRNLRPLERQGWLKIATGQDRRVRIVSLTPAGQELLQTAYREWETTQARFVSQFGAERWRGMLAMLRDAVVCTRRKA